MRRPLPQCVVGHAFVVMKKYSPAPDWHARREKKKPKRAISSSMTPHYAGRGGHAQEMRHKEILAPDWSAPVCGGVVAVQDPIGNIGAGGAVDAAVAVMPSGHIGWVATVLESVPGIKLAVGVPGVV